MANERIKQAAREGGVKLWRVAEIWGCTDGNFSRKLRWQFSPEDERRALKIIEELRKEDASNAEDAHNPGSRTTCSGI